MAASSNADPCLAPTAKEGQEFVLIPNIQIPSVYPDRKKVKALKIPCFGSFGPSENIDKLRKHGPRPALSCWRRAALGLEQINPEP